MDALRIVEQEILAEGMQEFLGVTDGIFVGLDEFFRESSLVAFDTAIDAGATWVAPVMGNTS